MKKLLVIAVLLVSGLGFSQSNDCKGIIVKEDKFKNRTITTSPYYHEDIYFTHCKGEQVEFSAIRLFAYGSTVNVGEQGVYILFKNGSKLIKENEEIKVDYDTTTRSYKYSASIILSKEEIELFQSTEIEAYKLYIYDMELKPKESEKFKNFANCVLKLNAQQLKQI